MTHEEIEEIRERLTAKCGQGTFAHKKKLVGGNLFIALPPNRARLYIPWLEPYDKADLDRAIEEAIPLVSDGGDVVIRQTDSRLFAEYEEIEPPFSPP